MDQRKRIKLTKASTEAGWASKFAPGDLEQALEGIAPESLGGFLSGREARDDAWYVPFGGLLLQTADFFAPVAEDPYRFGQITAAVVGEVVEGAGVRVTA
jgi:selenide, water dikinase